MTDDTLATVTEDTPPAERPERGQPEPQDTQPDRPESATKVEPTGRAKPKPKTKRQTKRTGPAPVAHRKLEGENKEAPSRHTVRPGDTLDLIAKEYGITVDTIIKANRFDLNKPRMIIGRDIYLS